MKAAHKCYLYTRVSTFMQVDGYSLDAQKDKLRKYAEFQEMQIMGEYSDEGKSGKNVEGRPEFLKMLRDSFKNCRLAIKKMPKQHSGQLHRRICAQCSGQSRLLRKVGQWAPP